MDRRTVLRVGIGAAVGALAVRRTAAQDNGATPSASPAASPVARPVGSPVPLPIASPVVYRQRYFGAVGVVEAVSRSFEPTNRSFFGPSALYCTAYVFGTDDSATVGLAVVHDGYVAYLSDDFDVSPLRPASVGDLVADDSAALSGEVTRLDDASATFIVGILTTRNTHTVRQLVCVTQVESALPYLFPVYDAIDGRQISDEPVTVDRYGYHTGGPWSLLPTLDDVPAGLSFEEDAVV